MPLLLWRRGECMKKFLFILVAIVGVAVGIYFVVGLLNSSPPKPIITVEGKKVEVAQGSYCWKGLINAMCVDTASPNEIVKFKNLKPVVVSAQSLLKIEYKKEPIENTLGVNGWINNEESESVPINKNVIQLPKEKGKYVYNVFAHWDNGDSNYVFVVEVR